MVDALNIDIIREDMNMARDRKWYRIFLDYSREEILLATVNSKGLANLTLNYYKTVYPEDRLFKLRME